MALRDFIERRRPLAIYASGRVQRMLRHVYKEAELYLTNWDKISPVVNVFENNGAFRLEVELPGAIVETLDVNVGKYFLVISAEKRCMSRKKEETCLRHESAGQFFYRKVPIPEGADIDKANAVFKNGILTIWLPKREGAMKHPRRLQIKNPS